ncbi:hypothetical protein N7478_003346 [Penicillium angulare]|uniref:uncharacterized protein n=1 Tax=Penicillium angulare TaxID=116970 RepID=UPI0025417E7D|nr:uncharacterized protein N7478_003346 [Penicillium angulare]KAJ5287660.1 hypothetical protein N7478_003346 [Penicillium angulare]
MLFQTTAVVLFVASSSAHSWVEQLSVIAPNGTFTGTPGYARGNYLRTAEGFNDTTMTYLIPPNTQANTTVIYPTTKLCKGTQQDQTQTPGSPRLEANAGDAIALRYQENGHVTLPWNQPGKPPNRGTVFVYGTTEPKVGETLLDVHGVWNWDGTGGDGRGVLLSEQNFDDGRCYQINTGNISEARQEKYPHQANQLMGADLWCQQDAQLPNTAPSGKVYTLYWVWDWPTLPDIDPTYPDGKKEIYTTCMDIDVVDKSTSRVQVTDSYIHDQSLDNAAIPSELNDLTNEDAVTVTDSSSTASAALNENTGSASVLKSTTQTAQTTQIIQSTQPTTSASAATVTVTVGAVTAWRTVTKVEIQEHTVTINSCQSTGNTG